MPGQGKADQPPAAGRRRLRSPGIRACPVTPASNPGMQTHSRQIQQPHSRRTVNHALSLSGATATRTRTRRSVRLRDPRWVPGEACGTGYSARRQWRGPSCSTQRDHRGGASGVPGARRSSLERQACAVGLAVSTAHRPSAIRHPKRAGTLPRGIAGPDSSCHRCVRVASAPGSSPNHASTPLPKRAARRFRAPGSMPGTVGPVCRG